MALHKLVAVAGSAATTFLLVAVVVIEAVSAATGADVGPGIVGVTVGALAAIAAVLAVSYGWDRVRETARWILLGYAAFGLTVLFLAGLSYVNVPGADEYLGLPLNLAIAAVVALAVAVGGVQWGGRPSPA